MACSPNDAITHNNIICFGLDPIILIYVKYINGKPGKCKAVGIQVVILHSAAESLQEVLRMLRINGI